MPNAEVYALQIPIADRAGALVGFFDIRLHNCQIALNHIERGMAEESLQGVHIATIAQVLNCKRVAETMHVDTFYAGALPNGDQHLQQPGAGELAGRSTCGEQVLVVSGIWTGGEVSP